MGVSDSFNEMKVPTKRLILKIFHDKSFDSNFKLSASLIDYNVNIYFATQSNKLLVSWI